MSKGKRKRVRKMLRTMHPGKVASVLEALDPEQRQAVCEDVANKDVDGSVRSFRRKREII